MKFGISNTNHRGHVSSRIIGWTIWGMTYVILCILVYIVATRADSAGADTQNYRSYFIKTIDGWNSNLDIGYSFLMKSVALITKYDVIFFGVTFSITTAFMLLSIHVIAKQKVDRQSYAWPLLAIGLLTLSSWYNTATLNGIRQGISLSIFYYAVILAVGRKYIGATIFFLLAPAFHITTLLLIPPVLMALLSPLILIIIIFYGSAALYAAGITEIIVRQISILSGLDVYTDIMQYANSVDRWRGFQLDLFAYTVFWPTFYLLIMAFNFVGANATHKKLTSIYMSLCIPYFFLGIGSYSNRFAIMGWFFLPLLHFLFIYNSRVGDKGLMAGTAAILMLGLVKYVGFVFGVDVWY